MPTITLYPDPGGTPSLNAPPGGDGTIDSYWRTGGSWVWLDPNITAAAALGYVDEAITSSPADGDTGVAHAPGNNIAGPELFLPLTNVPGDFNYATAVSLRLSTFDYNTRNDDPAVLSAGIYTTAAINSSNALAHGGSGNQQMKAHSAGSWTSGGLTAPAYNDTIAFNTVDQTRTASEWNGGFLAFYWSDTRNMGGDGAAIVLVDVEVIVTYVRHRRVTLPRWTKSRNHLLTATRW